MDIHIEFSGKDGIVALAGGGQVGATLLDKNINLIDTVSTTADSCILDEALPTVAGSTVKIREVVNLSANDMDLYPAVGEEIQVGTGLIGVDVPVNIAAGNGMKLYCFTAGIWRTF